MGKFIGDIVLQVLSFVAQNERESIRQRQAEGIKIAHSKGVHMGRPFFTIPSNYDAVMNRYFNKEITNVEARKLLGMSRGTFFKYLRQKKAGV